MSSKTQFSVFKSKLSFILLTRILLISGLFTVLITALQLYSDYHDEINNLHRQLILVEATQSNAIATSLWDFNEPLVQQQLNGIVAQAGINYAKIVTGFGKIYSTGTIPDESKINLKARLSYSNNDIGYLEIHADENIPKNKIKEKFYLVLVSHGIKTFIVSIFILFFIHKTVIRHVEQISDWLKTFKPELPFTPIPTPKDNDTKDNEICYLKNSINVMGKLVHINTISLEKLVEQRTAELNKRTEELETTQQNLHNILHEKQQKLDDVTETINDWLIDLDVFGNITSISEEFSQLLGVDTNKKSPLPLSKVLPFINNDSSNDVQTLIEKILFEKNDMNNINCQLQTNNHETIWISLTAKRYFSSDGEFQGYHCSIANITQQKNLEKLAYTDSLTGIANRISFLYKVDKELKRSRRLTYYVGVMMLDLDHFKQVNDNYGHNCGDEVLIKVAAALKSCLREEDCIGRIGGEEFAIIVPGANKLGLHKLATRLQEAVSMQKFSFFEKDKKITVSMGYTVVKNDEKFNSALNRADKHLYSAKANGRNCFVTDKEFIPNIVS
jgi:diguanylate cyclase (GGDEF)-like protein/PAS domain S-box-containing protein